MTTPSRNLTRWNRAGLGRFEYIDGNAVTFLEDLRLAFVREFPEWDALRAELKDLPLELADEFSDWVTAQDEDPTERVDCRDRERFLKQYYEFMTQFYGRQTQDFGWEIARGLARACHVLTGHVNAFANEGYIGTATQWESLRRLASMLDYHPHPPASASTPLALLAKEGASGSVEKGLQLKHSPPEGGPPVVFETLTDIDVDVALNAIRLKGWNRARGSFKDVGVAPPLGPIREQGVQAIQGVGEIYSIEWKAIRADTIEALAVMDPAAVRSELDSDSTLSLVRLREFKTKAEMVLAFRPNLDTFKAIRSMTLAGIAAETTDELTNRTGQNPLAVETLKREMRAVQIALDEPVFQVARLDEFGDMGDVNLPAGTSDAPHWHWVLPQGVEVSAEDLALAVQSVVVDGMEKWDAAVVTPELGSEESRALHLIDAPGQPDWREFQRADALLLINPKSTLIPRLNGPKVIEFESPHGLSEGNAEFRPDIVAWEEAGGDWTWDEVAASDELSIRLSVETPPPVGTPIYKALLVGTADDTYLRFELDVRSELVRIRTTNGELTDLDPRSGETVRWDAANGVEVVVGAGASGASHYRMATIILGGFEAAYLLPEEHNLPGRVEEVFRSGLATGGFTFDGEPEGLEVGRWVVGDTNVGLRALRIANIQEEESLFILGLTASDRSEPGALKRLYGPFKNSFHAAGYNYNTAPISGATLELDHKGEFPNLLGRGREIVIEQVQRDDDEKFQNGVKAVVTKANSAAGTIDIEPPLLPETGFTRGNTVIHGNVVVAGHGERRPEKILGGGVGTVLNQSFVLNVADVSFIADSTQPTGVRADIDVIVDGKIWEQVPTLNDSRPEDSHYVIRMTEDKFVRIQFGDGTHGRRVPTGANNIRVRYRAGTGLSGNLSPDSFKKLARPHRLLEGLRQSLDCTGGNDMEGVESLRTNAASGLVTMERAVSLADFTALANTQSSVWQAKAFERIASNPGFSRVEVVVVPAGGGQLGPELKDAIGDFLRDHALPIVEVTVKRYVQMYLNLSVRMQIDSAEFIPEEVAERVREALFSRFRLENRKLSQPLYRSEVYQVVEAVQGVSNSFIHSFYCTETDRNVEAAEGAPNAVSAPEGEPDRQVLEVADDAVIYFHPTGSNVTLTHQEFEL